MLKLFIAFLLGNLVHRIYYARINTRTDWMRSIEWSNNKWYQKLHKWACEVCPKRHYCETYKKKHMKEKDPGIKIPWEALGPMP